MVLKSNESVTKRTIIDNTMERKIRGGGEVKQKATEKQGSNNNYNVTITGYVLVKKTGEKYDRILGQWLRI